MAIYWGELKAQIARRLQDPNHRRYSEQLLADAVNDALIAFATGHTGVASTHVLTGDGVQYEFDLPGNIIDCEGAGVYAVHWLGSIWLKRIEYFPGGQWPGVERTTSSAPVGYVLWPMGKISFTRVPVAGQRVTLFYVAYYDRVTGDNTLINIPRWAEEPIKLYTMAIALEPGAAKASNLRQYNSRRDAGEPEDNPLRVQAEYYLKRYYEILAQYPLPQYTKIHPPVESDG